MFQGRNSARTIFDGADLANVARYIHNNPATFTDPREYRWSDMRCHCLGDVS